MRLYHSKKNGRNKPKKQSKISMNKLRVIVHKDVTKVLVLLLF